MAVSRDRIVTFFYHRPTPEPSVLIASSVLDELGWTVENQIMRKRLLETCGISHRDLNVSLDANRTMIQRLEKLYFN